MKVNLVDASTLHLLFPGIRWFEGKDLEPVEVKEPPRDARAILGPIPRLRVNAPRPVASESRWESASNLPVTRKTVVTP